MRKEIARFVPMAEAVAKLLHPYAEVVLHDTEANKIAAIFNSFSRRKSGESADLENQDLGSYPDYFEPYYKVNFDGRRLKSTTMVIRDDSGEAVGLLCINIDLSKIDQFKAIIEAFTSSVLPRAEDLFKDDWREKINAYVQDYAARKQVPAGSLSREEKRDVIANLHQEGAFRAKKAADHVAAVLGLSRATVYKHLPRVKK